jgi:cell division protein FtsB
MITTIKKELAGQKYLLLFANILICAIIVRHSVWGETGFMRYLKEKKEVKEKTIEVLKLQEDIETLVRSVKKWDKNRFNVEKNARHDLCMGKKNEIIYVL